MPNIFSNFDTPFKNTPAIAAVPTKIEQPKVDNPIRVQDVIAASKSNDMETDEVQISSKKPAKKEKAKKEGPIKKLKRFVAGVKKVGVTIVEFAKGIGKGILGGVVAGGAALGLTQLAVVIRNHSKQIAQQAETAVQHVAKKGLATSSKVVGAIVGVAVLAANLWKASLNAQDARSDIHDRYIGTDKK